MDLARPQTVCPLDLIVFVLTVVHIIDFTELSSFNSAKAGRAFLFNE